MSVPKISVIVPVHNNGKYLSETLTSLLQQSYSNLEIILVNDGSIDNSGEVCDSFAKNYPNVFAYHQENQGVSVARNFGMEKATGSLIGFCDGDDCVEKDYYEFLYNQMLEENSDMAGCNCQILTEDLKPLNNPTGEKIVWENNDDFLKALFKGEIPMGVCNKLFKKELIADLQFPEGYKINEDKYFTFLAGLKAKKFSYENVGKYIYTRRKNSSSNTVFTEKYFDSILLAQKTYEIICNNKPELKQESKANLLMVVLSVYKLIYIKNGVKKFKEEEKQLREYIKKFEKSFAKEYLSKKNYIRYSVIKAGRIPFKLLVLFFDKK